jgi:hypothetical protein
LGVKVKSEPVASRFEEKNMKIERFEDIEAWQLARELTRKVYESTKKAALNGKPLNAYEKGNPER